jgi:hypothetical protein
MWQVRPMKLGMKKYLFVVRHERSTSVENILPFSKYGMFQPPWFYIASE